MSFTFSSSSGTLAVRQHIAAKTRVGRDTVSERELSKTFNLSRNESRKLLAAMEHDGLLRCVPRSGYRVIDYRQVRNQTLVNLRRAVEQEAARLACEEATREDMVRLSLILEDSLQAIAAEDGERFRKLDMEFHQALVDSSHDALVQQMYGILFFQTLRLQPWTFACFTETHQDHQAILQALRGRDAEAVWAAVHKHGGGGRFYDGMVADGRGRGVNAEQDKKNKENKRNE